MNRTRLALSTVILAATWFLLGRLWPVPDPAPSAQVTAPGAFNAFGKQWLANPTQMEAFFRSRSRAEQDTALIALLAASRNTAGTAVYDHFIFDRYGSIWRAHRGSKDAVVLEIGPGRNLGQGLLFVLTGARKYIGLDLYNSPIVYEAHNYEAVHALLRQLAPESLKRPPEQIFTARGDRVVFDPERIEYLVPRESYDLRLPDGSVDFVFSNSVFEHISDPERTAQAIAKVLRRGGLSAHHVDFRDHRDFSKPLEFLKEDEPAWVARFTGPNRPDYTNRRRLPDIVAAFERAGLKIRRIDRTRTHVSEAMRSAMHADFRKYSLADLEVIGAMIVLEKP